MGSKCCHDKDKKKKIIRRIFAGFLIFAFIVLVTVLIIWAILRPTKPTFTLQDATVYAFNTSVPNFLTSNFQITISSKNPNDRIGVYYDRLDTYASYHDQQITLRTQIPPTYQGHNDVNVWSPFVYGNMVPVAPYNSLALSQDQARGSFLLDIIIDGRIRWKVGTFISGGYHIHVRCPAYISNFGYQSDQSASTGMAVDGGNAVKYQLVQRCRVNV